MPDLTPAELASLKELCEKATPEPWEYGDEWGLIIRRMELQSQPVVQAVVRCVGGLDQAFVLAARSAVPRLIAALEQREAEIAELRRRCFELQVFGPNERQGVSRHAENKP